MADFNKAVDWMLPHEDPTMSGEVKIDNNGGQVRYGVNSIAFPHMAASGFYTTDAQTALTMAKELYQQHQWVDIQGGLLTDDRVGAKLLDMAVNMGSEQAIKLAQRSAGIHVNHTGVMTPTVIATINRFDTLAWLGNTTRWWDWFIRETIKNRPQDKQYQEGWTARAKLKPF